jgi:hypothetical protein
MIKIGLKIQKVIIINYILIKMNPDKKVTTNLESKHQENQALMEASPPL